MPPDWTLNAPGRVKVVAESNLRLWVVPVVGMPREPALRDVFTPEPKLSGVEVMAARVPEVPPPVKPTKFNTSVAVVPALMVAPINMALAPEPMMLPAPVTALVKVVLEVALPSKPLMRTTPPTLRV